MGYRVLLGAQRDGQARTGDGIGTYGLGHVGVWGDADNPNGTGVVGRGGAVGGYFNGSGPQRSALALNDGGIKVVGAGSGTATPVFVHAVTANNQCGQGATAIDNPYANGHPDAMLFITERKRSLRVEGVLQYGPAGCPSDRWAIFFSIVSQFPDRCWQDSA